eukprot:353532-Chlamydomonas_euryale.AAC.13
MHGGVKVSLCAPPSMTCNAEKKGLGYARGGAGTQGVVRANPPPDPGSARLRGADALYFFALQHQESFDVKWCRGAVGERLLRPLAAAVEERGGAVMGSRFVREVASAPGGPGCGDRERYRCGAWGKTCVGLGQPLREGGGLSS